jgi:cold shock CspA family protein
VADCSAGCGGGIDPYKLREGDPLSFDIGTDRNNKPIAINVRLK